MPKYYFLFDDYKQLNVHLDKITRIITEIKHKSSNNGYSANDPYHENFAYTEQHGSQFKWSRRLMELFFIRDNAEIVTPEKSQAIMPGTRVTYRENGSGAEKSILVGSHINFCMQEGVPCGTRFAGKLIGKNKGDIFEVSIRKEKTQIEVLDARNEYQPVTTPEKF